AGHPVLGAEFGDRIGVVQVAVAGDHRRRAQPPLGHHRADQVRGLHPGIDDHAVAALGSRHQVAVGLPRPRREGCDQHNRDTIGQDGSMSPDADPASFGRVDADGTVYVRTAAGERSVGQVPDTDPAEALQFFVRRYTALELEVSLLEKRIASGTLSPDDAAAAIKTVRSTVTDAHAVGDLDGLLARLDALQPGLDEARAARRAERARQQEETKAAKERCVAEAERLAAGTDWRGGVNRFRSLLEEWKQLPRLDRTTDGELWHRFSSARTTYTRRRQAHFAQQAEQREHARVVKERLVKAAEALADSTDWGETTRELRGLMAEWKAAGPAPRDVDETLWKQFRAAQDHFFAAKQAAFAAQDAEFRENQTK